MSGLSYMNHLGRSVLWFAFSYIPLGVAVALVCFPSFVEQHSGLHGLPVLQSPVKEAALLAMVLVYMLGPAIKAMFVSTVHFELHGYQKVFLGRMASAQGLASEAAALQSIVEQAASTESVKKAIFDDFHCVHCGSKNPPEWINSAKGKTACPLPVSAEAVSFLSGALLVPVGPPGPSKKVQDGPRRADPHKAARCCIDWAIKEYGDEGKGKGK
jgi:hypothetical protein